METNTNIYKIYIGLNDQKEKVQLINTNDALVIVSEYLANNFVGATAYNAIGIYKHENGEVVRENSIVIELVFVNDEDVMKMINHFREVFNQESVMKVVIPCNCDFIG